MVPTLETAAVRTGKKSAPNRITFTPFALKRLPVPTPMIKPDGTQMVKQVDWWDSTVPGFGLRISSTGRKTWTMLARLPHHGQHAVRRFTLGLYAERVGDGGGLTLAEARRKFGDYKQNIAGGGDPERQQEVAKHKVLRESGQTFGKLAQEFLNTHHPKNKKVLKPSTKRRYTGILLGPDLAPWHDRPLASITRRNVIDLLHHMQQRVTVSTNRTLAVLNKFFRWSIQRDLIEFAPTHDIQPPAAETARARHLFGSRIYNRPSELALVWHAAEQVGPLGVLVKLLLLTGQRLNEVVGLRDEELLDLAGPDPRWHLPGVRTKNSKDHVIPLGPLAVQLLTTMPRLVGSTLFFTTTGSTPMSGFTNFKKRIDREIDTLKQEAPTRYAGQFKERWTFHDLRRSFKTGLAELGVPGDIRDSLLNHARQGVEGVYNIAEYEQAKRAAVVLWEKHITALMQADEQQSTKRISLMGRVAALRAT